MSQPTPPPPFGQTPGPAPQGQPSAPGPGYAAPAPGQPGSPHPGQPGPVPPTTPPPVQKKGAARIVVPLVIGIVALFVGIGIGSSGGTDTASPDATVTVTTTAQGEAGGTATATETATATATVTVTEKPAAPKTTKKSEPVISDGQYEVGTDIQPGRYKTVTPAEENSNFVCYADVQYNGDYLAQEVTDKGNTIITIPNKKGAIFTSRGCGEWKKIS